MYRTVCSSLQKSVSSTPKLAALSITNCRTSLDNSSQLIFLEFTSYGVSGELHANFNPNPRARWSNRQLYTSVCVAAVKRHLKTIQFTAAYGVTDN